MLVVLLLLRNALLVLVLTLFGDEANAADKGNGPAVCHNNGVLKFDPLEPMQRESRLDMCNQYRANTCCNATHVALLKRPIHETRAANFNEKCRTISETMTCRPCHPYVGTGSLLRVCDDLCDQWYAACSEEYYQQGLDGQLIPCFGDALICSPLNVIVQDGAELCKAMRLNFQSTTEDVDVGSLDCFDGTAPLAVGIPEPRESWTEMIKRTVMEQFDAETATDNPLMVMVAGLLLLLITARRLYRDYKPRSGTGSGGHRMMESDEHLTIAQVRERQQLYYQQDLAAAAKLNGQESDEDSDYNASSSEDSQAGEDGISLISTEDEIPFEDTTQLDPLGVLAWKKHRRPPIGGSTTVSERIRSAPLSRPTCEHVKGMKEGIKKGAPDSPDSTPSSSISNDDPCQAHK